MAAVLLLLGLILTNKREDNDGKFNYSWNGRNTMFGGSPLVLDPTG